MRKGVKSFYKYNLDLCFYQSIISSHNNTVQMKQQCASEGTCGSLGSLEREKITYVK